jgi:hypothetical protein
MIKLSVSSCRIRRPRPAEEEASEVGAADEQHETGDDGHESDEPEQRHQRLGHSAVEADPAGGEDFHGAESLVRRRMFLRQLLAQHTHRCARFVD